MKIRRLVGVLFLAAAAAGSIFSVVGLFEIWRFKPVVSQPLIDTLALLDQTLKTTLDGLTVISQAVETIKVDVVSLQNTTSGLAQTIHDTNPMLDSLTNLTSRDFPAAVTATQTSLTSAQSSALLIDNMLTTLSSIPFLSMSAYQPDVPLHTSLAQVSSSLDTLPPALVTITTSLKDGKTNLGIVEVELTRIAETTKQISSTLDTAQTVISQYKVDTTKLKVQVEIVMRLAPGWITTFAWILTFVLCWFLIAQFGLFMQGLEILRERREEKNE